MATEQVEQSEQESLHIIPMLDSHERPHELTADCWCGPVVEEVTVSHACGHDSPCERHPL